MIIPVFANVPINDSLVNWLLAATVPIAISFIVTKWLQSNHDNALRAKRFELEQIINSALDSIKQRLEKIENHQIISEERYKRQEEFNRHIFSSLFNKKDKSE